MSDAWEDYYYPGTQVLRHKAEIRDAQQLEAFEREATAQRSRQLRENPELIQRTYDAQHLQAVHRHLFQDVYDWAGQPRQAEMKRGIHQFASTESVHAYLERAEHRIAATDWKKIGRDEFVAAIAEVYGHLDQAHTFREGNGRTGRVFVEHVAEQSPTYRLDFSKAHSTEWITASIRAAPAPGTTRVRHEQLRGVFYQVTQGQKPTDGPIPEPTRAERLVRELMLDQPLKATESRKNAQRQEQVAEQVAGPSFTVPEPQCAPQRQQSQQKQQ